MIVKKTWYKHKHYTRYDYMGIFLFGFIPVFINRTEGD
jgi:hypothetical protein